jgi:hypothetical protein
MYNYFAITILERLVGRAPAVVLAELSGTTERTWRNRIKKGWEPTEEEYARFDARTTAALAEHLVNKGGWSIAEAQEILAGRPSQQAGLALPTADLVYHFSPRFGVDYQQSITMAAGFDRDCDRLLQAVRAADLPAMRVVLGTMLDWLLSFSTDATDLTDAEELRGHFDAAPDVEILLEAAKPLGQELIFHVLSCWDVEFCARYFDGTMQATPLFPLVMPRIAPGIDIEPGTGRLLRAGRAPRQRVLEPGMSRLLDFIAVLVAWRRNRRLPARPPLVKDFAAWCKQEESRIVSWRDQTTRFTARQLEQIWMTSLSPDSEGVYPAVPSPMFVCAHLWSPLLARQGGRVTQIYDFTSSYAGRWRQNRDRLVNNGLQFGEKAWPAYLTQPSSSICADLVP